MKMEALSALQERGLAIAATGKLVRDGDTWLVPSQTGRGRYARRHAMLVPGLRTARAAVQAHLCGGVCGGAGEAGRDRDGYARRTCHLPSRLARPQQGPDDREGNVLQAASRSRLDRAEPYTEGDWTSSPAPFRNAVRGWLQGLLDVSGRRFQTDLRDAVAKGFIAKAPHYNSVFNVIESEDVTPILH